MHTTKQSREEQVLTSSIRYSVHSLPSTLAPLARRPAQLVNQLCGPTRGQVVHVAHTHTLTELAEQLGTLGKEREKAMRDG